MLENADIRDRLMRRMPLPPIVIGDMESRDNSTFTEDCEEHLPILFIGSKADGRRQGNEIAERLQHLLLEGYVLESLFQFSTRTRRKLKSNLHVSDMRFRAISE